MDKVILHVGPNKTGTTALQAVFHANAALLARHHIAYPMTGRTLHAHHGIANACRDGDESLLGDLADEIRPESAVLLSSELFTGLDPPALGLLRRVFGEAQVEVAYTLRRLPELWPSHWKEMVKHGQDLSFPAFIARPAGMDRSTFSAPPLPSYQLNALAQVFGRDALRISIYEATQPLDRDVGIEFARKNLRFGDQERAFATPQLNQTPADWKIEVLRLINLRANSHHDAAGKRKLAREVLTGLNADPPEWVDEFRELFDAADTVTLSSQSPAVVSEQSAVLDGFGDRLLEPPEPYKAPTETSTRAFDIARLNAGLTEKLDALFESFTSRN